MQQAILYGAGDLRLEEHPLEVERLRDGEFYVETLVSALSTGTDLGNYLGRSSEIPGAPNYPRPVGYSNVGVIRQVGSTVDQGRVGERVFSLKPHQSAYIARRDELMVPIPHSVSSEVASLAYLTQLGLAALRQARYEAGENLAVIGLGVIGLCACALGHALGAKVVGIANSSLRAEAARRLGAHATFLDEQVENGEKLDEAFGRAGADIVLLTANPWAAYHLAVQIARYGGRIAILGFPGRGQPSPPFNPLDPKWFYGKQLSLMASGFAPSVECNPAELRFNLRRNLEYIFRLLATGDLHLEQVISHRFAWYRMQEAYELARQHSKDLMAAVFDWSPLRS